MEKVTDKKKESGHYCKHGLDFKVSDPFRADTIDGLAEKLRKAESDGLKVSQVIAVVISDYTKYPEQCNTSK